MSTVTLLIEGAASIISESELTRRKWQVETISTYVLLGYQTKSSTVIQTCFLAIGELRQDKLCNTFTRNGSDQ